MDDRQPTEARRDRRGQQLGPAGVAEEGGRSLRNSLVFQQLAKAPQEVTIILHGGRLVVLGGEAFLERGEVRLKTGKPVGYVHHCAPGWWSNNLLHKPLHQFDTGLC